MKNIFSPETIKRLSLYLRDLKRLQASAISTISSDKISALLGVTPVQFRKDLSHFGGFGKPGVGYEVDRLIREIENILGVNKQWSIALVGAGRLGSALLGFDGFFKFNLNIAYAFDIRSEKIGKKIKGVKIERMANLEKVIRERRIRIAIISTPPECAQSVADRLVRSGVRGILNFAPVVLNVPGHVSLSNVDMACELESLVFFSGKSMRETKT